MPVIQSKVSTASADFKKNQTDMNRIISEYTEKLHIVKAHGSESAVEKKKKPGKRLARERIELLIDPGTAFLELNTLAAFDQYKNQFPSAGVVTGIGVIHGKEVMIVANDATVKGGTYIRETIKKHIRAQEIALENYLPCIYMVDSGGIFLPNQADVFADKTDFGRIFYNQAVLSSKKIPQISIVMGSCTAGGAYVPAMSDEAIIVKNQGTIFIGGPPLVKAATGEVVSAEDLGGADVHTRISGVADHFAENDDHAIQICRDIVQTLRPTNKQKLDLMPIEDPRYNPEELLGIIPQDLKKPIDAKEVIARIVDGSRFHEFKARYAPTIVCGFAHIMGYPVGILASNGVLFSETSLKGAHFIELCTSRQIPLVFLQNITGFIVGKQYEHGGIARDGAKLVHAVSCARVPKFTVIFGGSYGAGNYAMCGRAYDARLLFMWPNARISVMGGAEAANVLVTVKEEALVAMGKTLDPVEKQKMTKEILDKYECEGSPYYSTSRLWDDGIILPTDTRNVLGLSISMSLNKPFKETEYGIFRM